MEYYNGGFQEELQPIQDSRKWIRNTGEKNVIHKTQLLLVDTGWLKCHILELKEQAYQASTFGSTDSGTGGGGNYPSPQCNLVAQLWYSGNSGTDQSGNGNNL